MRIVAISDQHGYLPDIPDCDLLIVAGDQCPDYPSGAHDRIGSGPQIERQLAWFKDVWRPWRLRQPAKYCYVTWGNHDYCGQVLNQRGRYDMERTACIVDECVDHDGFKIWLSPWSSQFRDWAFMAEDDALVEKYAAIPAGIDVLVSHQPPYGMCDGAGAYIIGADASQLEHLGSKALRGAIHRVQPSVVICGHIHGGHGQWSTAAEYPPKLDVYNVALLDEAYKPQWAPTVIDL